MSKLIAPTNKEYINWFKSQFGFHPYKDFEHIDPILEMVVFRGGYIELESRGKISKERLEEILDRTKVITFKEFIENYR